MKLTLLNFVPIFPNSVVVILSRSLLKFVKVTKNGFNFLKAWSLLCKAQASTTHSLSARCQVVLVLSVFSSLIHQSLTVWKFSVAGKFVGTKFITFVNYLVVKPELKRRNKLKSFMRESQKTGFFSYKTSIYL